MTGKRKDYLVKGDITLSGVRTGIRLEPEVWKMLKEVCRLEGRTKPGLMGLITAQKKPNQSMASAIRMFILNYYQEAATEEGHKNAKHGYYQYTSDDTKAS